MRDIPDTWKGKRLGELSKEELIEVIHYMDKTIKEERAELERRTKYLLNLEREMRKP